MSSEVANLGLDIVAQNEMNWTPRETNLPQWAQALVSQLRRRVSYAEEAARTMSRETNPDAALIVVELPDGSRMGLDAEAVIGFYVPRSGSVAVHLDEDGGVMLETHGRDDRLAIEAVSGYQLRVVVTVHDPQ